jgi:hypothetical protein
MCGSRACGNEHEALGRDLDVQTERAIAAALREVR